MADEQKPTVVEALQAIPAPKRERKWAETVQGFIMFTAGVVMAGGTFFVVVSLIRSGREIDMWAVVLVSVLFGGGLLLITMGSHIMSREITSAALKDITGAIGAVWRFRGGVANGSDN